MRSIYGAKTNISEPTVLKLIKKKIVGAHEIYICKSLTYMTNSIFHISDIKSFRKTNYIYNININQFNLNDIIIIYPTGLIIFLFESQSYDNTLFLTNSCNSRCIFCCQTQYNDVIDYFSQIDLINNLSKKVKVLGISGGEPTFNKKDFLEIIATCKKRLPNTELEILTNGINFKDINFVNQLIFIGHMNMKFEIPIHGDTNDLHDYLAGTTSFESTISGIYNLAKFEQNIEIRVVLNKVNYKRLTEIAHFIYKNLPFVNHIAFMGLELEGRAVKNIDKLWIDPVFYMDDLYHAIEYLNMVGMNVSIYNLQLCLLPKKIWKFAVKSISSWKNIYFQECAGCKLKMMCGGFFSSSKIKRSNFIKPF